MAGHFCTNYALNILLHQFRIYCIIRKRACNEEGSKGPSEWCPNHGPFWGLQEEEDSPFPTKFRYVATIEFLSLRAKIGQVRGLFFCNRLTTCLRSMPPDCLVRKALWGFQKRLLLILKTTHLRQKLMKRLCLHIQSECCGVVLFVC